MEEKLIALLGGLVAEKMAQTFMEKEAISSEEFEELIK